MSAEGLTNTEIARRTGATRPTVISWRNRYATAGINALGDLPRPGRPPVVDELEVVATTLAHGGRPPAHLGVSQWSSRLLGQHLGVSFTTVVRIWHKWGIQPDVERFTFAIGLKQQAQVQDLDELYRNVSQRVAMLHRPVSASATEGQLADQSDPWLKLVEVSLRIIAQQAIRSGTFTSVRYLIDALGALTAGWCHEPSHRPPTTGENSADTVVVMNNRQPISDTERHLQERSSRSVESGSPRDPDGPAGPARTSRSVRAEFHGSRGRRSRPTSGAGG
jgi:transposase